jgi:hypothetical protein
MSPVKRQEFMTGAPRLTLAEARNQVHNAVLLAGLCMFVSAPRYYFLFQRFAPHFFNKKSPTLELLQILSVGQALIMFGVALLCCLVGFMYAHRLSLPGLGWDPGLKKWGPLALALGIAAMPVFYFALDRSLVARLPEFFPRPWYLALLQAAGSALEQEVMARFGLVTIGVYLLRWRGFRGHAWPAGLIVSVFMPLAEFLYISRLAFSAVFLGWQLAVYLGLSFVFQWVQAEVYLRKGLVAALAVHFGLGLRLVLYNFL